MVALGVILLRRTRPDLPRAFRTPLVPVVPILSVLASLWLMINLPAETWLRFADLDGPRLRRSTSLYGRGHSRLDVRDGQAGKD